MSLIKCPECNHSVSSKAPFCPNCGVQIEGNVKRCPVCGGYALMAAEQCPHCQTKFVVEDNKPQQLPKEERMEEAKALSAEEKVQASTTRTVNDDEKVEMVDPRAAKRGGGAPWYLLILAILLVAIGGFFYWENQNHQASEERDYELLRDCNNPLNYEDFIARYPSSRHVDDVRARLDELHREDALWQTVSQSNDRDALEQFVQTHPHSPQKHVALHKIDSLDWRAAEQAGTMAAFQSYISRHDNGEYIDQAFQARDAARLREEQARRDSIAAAEAARSDSIARAAAAAATMGIDVITAE